MEKEQLMKILQEEEYPEFMFEKTIEKILNFNSKIKEYFEQWLKDGNFPEIEIEGYTFTQLMCEFSMKPVGAFITLDWLIRDPEKAKNALKIGIK